MAEKRLIDANVLIELVADDLWAYEVEQFEHYVSKTPTVDAVEVVRCKDCKWCVSSVCRHGFGLNWGRDDDFCSYGERRTDG